MSSSSSPLLQLELRRSVTQRMLSAGSILTAFGIPWLVPGLSVSLSITLMAISLISVLLGLWRTGFLGARFQLRSLAWDPSGQWWLIDARGRHAVELRSDSVVFRHFLWLKWDGAPGMRQAFLLSSDYPVDDWRRWLTRLHFEARRTSHRTLQGQS